MSTAVKKRNPHWMDITGHLYGKLKVIRFIEFSRAKQERWECQCACGNITVVQKANLRSGHTTSCGCLEAENKKRLMDGFAKLVAKHPEWMEKAQEANRAAGGSFSIKGWRLRDPNNRVFEFRNLLKFLRENPEMFSQEDLKDRPKKGRKPDGTNCSAYIGLVLLRPTLKKIGATASWKGWTWFSQTERIKNEGDDLLSRGGTDK